MKRVLGLLLAIPLLGAVVSAHIMVSPPQSKPGITQAYELRCHNESKVATTSLELEIPQGISVTKVEPPSVGTIETPKTGDRITAIVWKVDVAPSKYVALKFEAKNPDGAKEIRWSIRQHLADGTVVDWSDRPGAKEKAPVTALSAATQ